LAVELKLKISRKFKVIASTRATIRRRWRRSIRIFTNRLKIHSKWMTCMAGRSEYKKHRISTSEAYFHLDSLSCFILQSYYLCHFLIILFWSFKQMLESMRYPSAKLSELVHEKKYPHYNEDPITSTWAQSIRSCIKTIMSSSDGHSNSINWKVEKYRRIIIPSTSGAGKLDMSMRCSIPKYINRQSWERRSRAKPLRIFRRRYSWEMLRQKRRNRFAFRTTLS
jgi:hypothetical protein